MLPSFLAGRTFCPVSCVDSSPDIAGDSADLLLPAGQHSTGCTGRQLPAPDPLPAQVIGTDSRPGITVENRRVASCARPLTCVCAIEQSLGRVMTIGLPPTGIYLSKYVSPCPPKHTKQRTRRPENYPLARQLGAVPTPCKLL
jgi:hypothetical protein